MIRGNKMGMKGEKSSTRYRHRPNIHSEDLQEDVFIALTDTGFVLDDVSAWDRDTTADPVMMHEVYDEGRRFGHTPRDASSWD
jgi:hypothetical protein